MNPASAGENQQVISEGDLHPKKEMLSILWNVRSIVYRDPFLLASPSKAKWTLSNYKNSATPTQVKCPGLAKSCFLRDRTLQS